ncbi:MAG TPA: YetF domain-containing protein [Pirellulales bacterium]|jgi:uncharacterized membrane protein YcaP (DUF421 family)|nr:YetF domain-containing protein [Pirellulales bacterium]
MVFADFGSPIVHVLTLVFGEDKPHHSLEIYQVAARAMLAYIIGLAAVRIGKGRGIGRITLLDILLGFMLGPLLSPAITGTTALSASAVGAIVLVAMYWLITFLSYRSSGFGLFVKGKARLIVEDGNLDRKNMRLAHFSENDLLEELRLHGIEDIQRVKRAYVERSGAISVIKQDSGLPR